MLQAKHFCMHGVSKFDYHPVFTGTRLFVTFLAISSAAAPVERKSLLLPGKIFEDDYSDVVSVQSEKKP